MCDLDTNTTPVPVLDRFKGDEALIRFSEKLMEWDGAPVTDREIADALGPGMVEIFRYAQKKLVGRIRKVTGEPSLCHSADVAIRAASLGYGEDVVKACLLHDVVEDTSNSYTELPMALAEIATTFSDELGQDIALLTNRYQLLFGSAAMKVSASVQPTQRGLDAFRAALDVLRYESDPSLTEQFVCEFTGIAKYLEGNIDLAQAQEVCRRDRKFNFAKFLEARLYALYINDIAIDAIYRVSGTNGRPPVPLITKSVDIIDNVRTSEISNRATLNKLVRKAETIIDVVQRGFLDAIPAELADCSTVAPLHRIVQIRLVDQIKLRRRAVAENFSETRFVSLVRFLADEGSRLNQKYRIPKNRVNEIENLEKEVRHINDANPVDT